MIFLFSLSLFSIVTIITIIIIICCSHVLEENSSLLKRWSLSFGRVSPLRYFSLKCRRVYWLVLNRRLATYIKDPSLPLNLHLLYLKERRIDPNFEGFASKYESFALLYFLINVLFYTWSYFVRRDCCYFFGCFGFSLRCLPSLLVSFLSFPSGYLHFGFQKPILLLRLFF